VLTLYGCLKTRSDRVLWALEEKGLPYDFEQIDLFKGEGRSPAFLALNPAGKIPLLKDGDLILTESLAICNYIADRPEDAVLAPLFGSKERTIYDQWCSFVISELEQPLWTISKHKFALPAEWRVPAVIDTARKEFAVAAQLLAQGLGDHEFIVGDKFSVADILIGHTLAWARAFEVLTLQPVVDAYADRLFARPAYVRVRDYGDS
jgi:glutathione S-transferase